MAWPLGPLITPSSAWRPRKVRFARETTVPDTEEADPSICWSRRVWVTPAMGPGLARYCTMTSSAALALRASYLTSVVTSWVDAVRCGWLGNSALNPASVALKTVGLSALLMVEPPHAPSRPIRSTRATATAALSGALRGASGGLLFTLALGREGTDRRHDLGVG